MVAAAGKANSEGGNSEDYGCGGVGSDGGGETQKVGGKKEKNST